MTTKSTSGSSSQNSDTSSTHDIIGHFVDCSENINQEISEEWETIHKNPLSLQDDEIFTEDCKDPIKSEIKEEVIAADFLLIDNEVKKESEDLEDLTPYEEITVKEEM